MDEKEVQNILIAFYKGILEFGLEEALNKFVLNMEQTEEGLIFMSAAWTGLFGLFLPELLNKKEFINVIAKCASEVDEEDLKNRIEAVIGRFDI